MYDFETEFLPQASAEGVGYLFASPRRTEKNVSYPHGLSLSGRIISFFHTTVKKVRSVEFFVAVDAKGHEIRNREDRNGEHGEQHEHPGRLRGKIQPFE